MTVQKDVRREKIEAVIRPQLRFTYILFFLFLALKLTDQISWSWLWVFAPLWIPWAAILGLVLVLGVLVLLVKLYDARLRRARRKRRLQR